MAAPAALAERLGIVVIGRNEGPKLERALASARAAGVPWVYVDSDSEDGSAERARLAGAQVVVLDASQPLTAARGRNAGREALRARAPALEYVQFLDGDSELQPGWIERAMRAFDEDADLVAVAGVLRERDADSSRYRRLCDFEWRAPTGPCDALGGICAMRLTAFDAAGGFAAQVSAGEEPELCLRLRRAGGGIERLDAPMAIHDSGDGGLRAWWRRAVRAGSASMEALAMHPAREVPADRRRARSFLFWGALAPLLVLGAWIGAASCAVRSFSPAGHSAWWIGVAPTLAWIGALVALFARITARKVHDGESRRDAVLFARFALLAKPAGAWGIARSVFNGRARAMRLANRSVAYVAGRFPLRSETFVYREVRELRRRGWRVLPVSLRDPGADAPEGSDDLAAGRVLVYGAGGSFDAMAFVRSVLLHPWASVRTALACARDVVAPGEPTSPSARARLLVQAAAGAALAGALRRERVARVHAHFAHAPAGVAMYAALHAGLPFSFTGHANDIFVGRVLLKRKLERAAFVACISEWHREFYSRIRPQPALRATVVRCGVDVGSWRPCETHRRTDERPVLLTVCRLVENKGVDTLVRALAETGASGIPSWELCVAGDGPERKALGELAAKLGVQDSVRFLGAVENEGVRELMARASAFALGCKLDRSGDRDGLPVVLMEAMASGLPTLAGDLPALRELVQHEVTGLLFDPATPGDLALWLERLRREPQWARQLAQKGRERVVEEFSLSTNVTRLEALLVAIQAAVR